MPRTFIKICGITTIEDAQAAVNAGVDAIGFVFYAKSPRYVTCAQASAIAQAIGPFTTTVGLFVDAAAADIQQVLASVPLHLLQFHGAETPSFCASFQRPFIKVLRMAEDVDVLAVERDYAAAGALGLLLDSFNPTVPGGTGETFAWERLSKERNLPLILAGGLSPDNVGAAVAAVLPYAVDVSSGVEKSPGCKDWAKIAAFVRAVRAADAQAT